MTSAVHGVVQTDIMQRQGVPGWNGGHPPWHQATPSEQGLSVPAHQKVPRGHRQELV